MMNRRTRGPKALSRLVLSLLLGLHAAAVGSAQPPSSPAKPAEPNRDSAGGRHEGIEVHGHWVIDVRNPDGSLAQHRDFENALQSDGANMLAQALTRQRTPGTWSIAVFGSPDPCGSTGSPRSCQFFEPQATHFEGTGHVPVTAALDLTYQTANLGVGTGIGLSVVLSGTATASQDTSINRVATRLGRCGDDSSPRSCTEWVPGPTGFGWFTAASASPTGPFTPVPVKPGQIIQVTVTISFS